MRILALALTLCAQVSAPALADDLEPRPQNVMVPHHDTDARPSLGPRYAPVTMDVFIDLTSRLNLKAYQHLAALAERHPRRLRMVFHVLREPGRTELAETALEAHAQGRFFALMDELARFSGTRHRLPAIDTSDIQALCERSGIDFRGVEAARADHRHVDALEQNELFFRRRRAPSHTLTLLANGTPSSLRSRDMSLARLEQLYDEAYVRAKDKLDRGAAIEDLYHLSLIEADAAIKPIRINAGLTSGKQPTSHSSVLDDAPLVASRALVGGYLMGPADARITLHLFCDFSSHYKACPETRVTLQAVREHFPGLVRVYFHHMLPPDIEGSELDSLLRMHGAGVCAERQGVFEEFYKLVYVAQARRSRRRRVFDPAKQIDGIIGSLNVDKEQFTACLEDPKTSEELTDLIRAARDAGITTSPTVIVGGRMYPGSKTSAEVIRLVEIELMPGFLEILAPSPTGSPDWLDELSP